MKKLLIVLLSFLIFLNVSAVDKIDTIKNGLNYKQIIDKFINNLSEEKLLIVDLKLSKLKTSKNNDLNILIWYLKNETKEKLLKIEEDKKLNDEINKIEEDLINTIEEDEKIISYKWFSNNYDEYVKTILAWESKTIYNWSVTAQIEELDIIDMEFNLNAPDMNYIRNIISWAELYVEWELVSIAWTSNISYKNNSNWKITFSNIKWFRAFKKQTEFRLKIITNNIWFEKIWKESELITIDGVKILKAEWVISWATKTNIYFNEWNESFRISPIELITIVDRSLNNSTIPEINIKANFWNNTWTNNNQLKAELKAIKLNYFWNWTVNFSLKNIDDSSDSINWIISWSTVSFDLSSLKNRFISSWKWETYRIDIKTENDSWIQLEIPKDWIIYSIEWLNSSKEYKTRYQKFIDLGYRKF